MNASIHEDTIDLKYLIQEKIKSKKNANLFLVKEKETNILYVAKVFKKETTEIEVLNLLMKYNNPYTVKIINSGEGDIIRKNKETKKRNYFILEYIPLGNLFDYIYFKQDGFGELYTKVIFYKIIEGIKFCHEHNICHRDLKLENILLNDNFCPKISGFNFAIKNSTNLKDNVGTLEYKPPEIIEGKEYEGKKADIFSLGVLLLILVIGFQGFTSTSNYKMIKENNFENYWKTFSDITLSEESKDLYIKMVSYNPDSRPSIEEILNHPWFNEIKEMNEEQKDKIEEEIKKEFTNLSQIIKNNFEKEFVAKDRIIEYPVYTTRTLHNDLCLFSYDIKVENINAPINLDNYIKIKGYINPNKFMNHLCSKIIKKFGEDCCLIEASKNKLKLFVMFEEEETDISDEEERILQLIIQIRLYKYSDGHILKLIQKDGNRKNFLDKINIISELVENIIC